MDAARGVVRHFVRRTGRVTAEQQKGLSSALKDEKLAKRTDKTKQKKNTYIPQINNQRCLKNKKKKKPPTKERKNALGEWVSYTILLLLLLL